MSENDAEDVRQTTERERRCPRSTGRRERVVRGPRRPRPPRTARTAREE